MKDKQRIIISSIQGKSINAISRDTGFHRVTVTKYIKAYNVEKEKCLNSNEAHEEEIITDFVEKPKYNSSTRKPKKVTPEILAEISHCLEENLKMRSNGQYKQQKKGTDIYEYLLSKNYDIGYTTVCYYVKKLNEHNAEAFIKQQYQPGEICEFDWGDVKVALDSIPHKLNMAVFTTAYEGYVYARLFQKQNTQSFQEAHACYFDKVQGVQREMVYDNMKVAVRNFVGRTEKEATEGLLKLSLFYAFDFRFCNIAAGNEKGHVERGVEFVRRKAFSKRNSFNSIEEANEFLEQICDELNRRPKIEKDGKTALELLDISRPFLLPVLGRFEASEYREARVDKFSTISVDTCHYSVPEKYVGKFLKVKISSNRIICFDDEQCVCKHDKLTGCHQWSMDIEHYLKTLTRKPGAVEGSCAFRQMDEELKSIFSKYFKDQVKNFIRLLIYIKENKSSIYEIKGIIENISRINPESVNLENIIALAERDVAPIQEYPENDIDESASRQLKELADLIPANEQLYQGGKVL
jgi:transposase